MIKTSRQLALALLLGSSATVAAAAAGTVGINPSPPSTLATRVGTTGAEPAVPLGEQLVQHEREQHERPSFAKSWVSRARGGGGSRVTADGGGERESPGRGGGGDGGGKDEVELALVGNFPNR